MRVDGIDTHGEAKVCSKGRQADKQKALLHCYSIRQQSLAKKKVVVVKGDDANEVRKHALV